jgi:hypothetical protein
MVEGHVSARTWRFKSSHPHRFDQRKEKSSGISAELFPFGHRAGHRVIRSRQLIWLVAEGPLSKTVVGLD